MKKIFALSLLVSVAIVGFRLVKFGIIDNSMWANQAEYVITNNPSQYDFAAAYGHPGGPIIEGVVAINRLTNISYDDSLLVFLAVLSGLLIASSVTLSYLITKNHFVWPTVLGLLSLNRMDDFATPPSLIASLSILFLCMLTLYFCLKDQNLKRIHLFLWTLVAGFSIATRIDIGLVMVPTFMAILKIHNKINWLQILTILAGIFILFALFDPFMWFMPIQHIKDLVYKIVFHYAEYFPTYLKPWDVFDFSILAFLSMSLGIIFVFKRKEIVPPLPLGFITTILLVTAFLYNVFLSAHYQAPRYFKPIILIWETLLPIFIFYLIPHIDFSFLKSDRSRNVAIKITSLFVVLTLIFYHLIYIWIDTLHEFIFLSA